MRATFATNPRSLRRRRSPRALPRCAARPPHRHRTAGLRRLRTHLRILHDGPALSEGWRRPSSTMLSLNLMDF
ncbi:hypothetical protein EVAR_18474_1 [Eumeta japonica]|uniref:Uncharacterized protein n=1 Tax=Eumeta variegata TaxID=151549 RepID=A0A4C1UZP7_EUMVA|nr:hypothetical protein EVAR_18474_1 [Eumeta japonica]